ncbi:MAG: flagellar hook assembly protein FlgD [Gammaproteobacteria bacterium]|nr:flagellar hook assembly protein FlgD [Gammaproteobacteria bacterium]
MNTIANSEDIYQSLGLTQQLEQQKSDQLQMEDFLNLMVTELTHQDPFKPMDNTELGSQISQFATVSGIEQLNDSFSDLSGNLISDQSLQATNLVGHNVLVPINTGILSTGGTVKGVAGLDASVNNLVIRVTNEAGALVREISMGTQPKGETQFVWDGMTDAGEAASPGTYSFAAQAELNGESVSPYLLMQAQVDSVSLNVPGQGIAVNLTGLGPINLNDIAEIY